ncbi:unnamed protein product [Effrenium voratum]|uniref:Uncharacterized protein n=1 Tax=Effrenium voratum TaxID=2562239 RepID=A0AA36JM06_9DINO|nr:unnamed protein product [Effrenium voratum]
MAAAPEGEAGKADDEVSDYGDDDGMQWYATAAAGLGEEPATAGPGEEPAPAGAGEEDSPVEDAVADDPYQLASDPYQLLDEEEVQATAAPDEVTPAVEGQESKRSSEKPVPSQRPTKVPKTANTAPDAFPEFMSVAATPKPKAKLTMSALPLKQLAEVLHVPPAPEGEASKPWAPSWLSEEKEPDANPVDTMAYATESVPEADAYPEDLGADQVLSWDERCVVVKQGQVHIELQRRKPPMGNAALLRFCDWLDEQMPLVVQHFPYVKKSGAYVDLSDNEIGTDGLDKLFQVLRDHRVPCVVLKAYRNSIDDSFVDTLVEYLYTQPEAFPMHGIHISHNSISDKGAFRLIRAAAQCGHYPRLTTRLPLWLRLEV